MTLIDDELGDALGSGKVRPKKNKTRPIRGARRAQEKRTSKPRRSPEVIVKVSGFTHGERHLHAHLAYISRKGKIEIENEEGFFYQDPEAIHDLGKLWASEIDAGNPPKTNRRDTVRVVLSMPPGTDPEGVLRATRTFAQDTFKNHAYVFALHTDEAHPHVHLTIQMRGFDGERLNPRKKDLQIWRERFAAHLLEEGVDCVATPSSISRRESARPNHVSQSHDHHAAVNKSISREVLEP